MIGVGNVIKTIRIANNRDVDSLKEFLNKAGLSSNGVEQCLDYFVVMEDEKGALLATLGIERVEQDGLLRSLVVSENLDQFHVLKLFQCIMTLARKRELKKLFLVTNKQSAVEFFRMLGFEKMQKDEIPENLLTSNHFRNSMNVEKSVYLWVSL
jgi:N-acetylglutamate synthase-like GNAT family acetyltransferase